MFFQESSFPSASAILTYCLVAIQLKRDVSTDFLHILTLQFLSNPPHSAFTHVSRLKAQLVKATRSLYSISLEGMTEESFFSSWNTYFVWFSEHHTLPVFYQPPCASSAFIAAFTSPQLLNCEGPRAHCPVFRPLLYLRSSPRGSCPVWWI